MRIERLRVLVLLAAALLPLPSYAQETLIGPTGLGRLVRPLDSRARGMGNAGVALHGQNLSAVNPASLTQLTSAGFWGTWLPETRTVKVGENSSDVSTVDFPLFRIAAPLGGRWAAAVSIGSWLDQDWTVQFTDTLGLSTGDVAFLETRQSDGGVTRFRFELAGAPSRILSLGAAGVVYRGETRRVVDRTFEEGSDLAPYLSRAAIKYEGWGFVFGAELRPIPEMIVGLAAGWGPGLEIREDSTGDRVDIDLPLTVDLGGSWQLTPGFLFALAGGWAGWSVADDQLPQNPISDAWYVAGGAEIRAVSGERTAVFLRVGGHWERQPFELRGGPPSERALNVGFGATFRGGRARLDASLEFGKRGSLETNNVEESFRRLSVTIGIFGG